MPDIHAGCPMANMITAEQLRNLKIQHPEVPLVAYVNTSAAVKAESNYCCTSGNAVKIVQALKEDTLIFVPDQYLGYWVSTQVKNKKFILWNGYCHIHVKILPEYIIQLKKEHPGAEVMVHPECTPPVIALADKVLGTGGMVKYAKESKAREFIIGTENGLLHRLKKENPEKIFYPAAPHIICPNMKLTTLEKVLWSLEDLKEQVIVPEEIRLKAKKAIDRMIEVAP
jgi:quinolinate synthase